MTTLNTQTPTAWDRIRASGRSVLVSLQLVDEEPAPEPAKTPCATCGAEGCPDGEACTGKACGCCDACKATGEAVSEAEATPPAEPASEEPTPEPAPDPPAEPQPCPTCGAADCPCGDNCTAKGCACCEACAATAEEEAPAEPAPESEPTPAEQSAALAAALNENARLKAALAAKETPNLQAEKAKRVDAEVAAFMKDHGSRMGLQKRQAFESLLRDAKLGVVSLRRLKAGVATDAPESERFETLSAPLSARASEILVASLEAMAGVEPLPGAEHRVQAGGPKVDAEVARVAGDKPVDADAARDAKVQARIAEKKYTGAGAYSKAYAEIVAEEANVVG